jgi:hypothetical protein
LVEMRRLAPLGQIIERLNALEESLRGGRAPAGGAGGAQTPPASSAGPAGLPPRRGSAVGGGRGPSSFSAGAPGAATPFTGFAASAVEGVGAGDAKGGGDAGAQTPREAPQRETPTRDTHAAGAPSGLKLVPPPAASFTGGAPSFAGGAASRADDAPFALGEAPTPARQDRVGQPVALVTSSANAGGAGAAVAPEVANTRVAAPEAARADGETGDAVSRIKRGLEERGKPLLAVAFEGARRVRIEGEEVRVEFAPEGKHLRDTLNKPENMRLLREVCCEVLGREVGVGVTTRAPGDADDEALDAEDEARREQKRLRERAEGHPVVQKVLKTFRAEIVDVRRADDAPQ